MKAYIIDTDDGLVCLNVDSEADQERIEAGQNWRELTPEECALFTDGIQLAGGEGTQISGTCIEDAVVSYIPIAVPLADLKTRALTVLQHNFSAASSECRGYYQCAEERETWDQQKKEAEAYTDDPLADTPFMDAFAAANPNMTKAQLAATILANSPSMATAAGKLGGQLSAKRASILSAVDKDGINAVDLSFSLPSINLTDK